MVIAEADWETLKQLRLCNKWFAGEAARHLFASVTMDMTMELMEAFAQHTRNKAIAKSIKELVVLPSPRWPRLDFEDFCEVLHKGCTFFFPVGTFSVNMRLLEGLCHRRVLTAPAVHQVQGSRSYLMELYAVYMADREEVDLFECLTRGLHPQLHGQNIVSPADANAPEMPTLVRYREACAHFESALLELSSLCTVRMMSHSTTKSDNWYGFRLRTEVLRIDRDDVDAAKEAAPRVFLLRALGYRNNLLKGLTSLELISKDGNWWVPLDLEPFWRSNELSETGGYEEIDESRVEHRLSLVTVVFAHLKYLRLEIEVEEAKLRPTARIVGQWLSRARKLERLELRLAGLRHGNCHVDFDYIRHIARGTQWTKLKDLSLHTTFTVESLLSFLSTVTSTLCSLSLSRCRLVGPSDSWPVVYERMRQLPFEKLQSLDFCNCTDRDPRMPPEIPFEKGVPTSTGYGWVKEYPSISVFYYSEPNSGLLARKGVQGDLYSYILKKTGSMPRVFRCRPRKLRLPEKESDQDE